MHFLTHNLLATSLLVKLATSFNLDRNGQNSQESSTESSSGENTTLIIEIDFNIVDGANQLITTFVTDTLFSQQILNHGCWCAKLNKINQGNVNLGGKTTIDEIDRICKEWHQARPGIPLVVTSLSDIPVTVTKFCH